MGSEKRNSNNNSGDSNKTSNSNKLMIIAIVSNNNENNNNNTCGMNMFLIQCWRMKDVKSLSDFPILADKVIEHRCPDIVCIDKIAKSCPVIDIALLGEQNIIVKEQEKLDKYQDLRIDLGKLWKLKAEVVLLAAGTYLTI